MQTVLSMSTQIQTASRKKVFVDLDSFDRIRAHSPSHINQSIEEQMQQNVHEAGAMDQNQLSQRIEKLDREWDIDRAFMVFFAATASTMALLSALAWSPPMMLLRRLKFRSSKEIDAEKYALKTLRGDFVQER